MTGTPDLLSFSKGLVVAPAGCGKTQLIADSLRFVKNEKPVLILTHTNAGVVALRNRLKRLGVEGSSFRLSTIDGWAMKIASLFPERAQCDLAIIKNPNYPLIRDAALRLLEDGHINDLIKATYSRLFVDEYQDCSIRQHRMVRAISFTIPTCVMGDDMQAIFGFDRNDPLAHWNNDVSLHFTESHQLTKPWRWLNANSGDLGYWLLEMREILKRNQKIDFSKAPANVSWLKLDGANDVLTQLSAAKIGNSREGETVLIIGDSRNPLGRSQLASQTPGAVTVEAVDLRDLVTFSNLFSLNNPNVLQHLIEFLENLMSNVGGRDLLNRLSVISRGSNRKPPTNVEREAVSFSSQPSFAGALALIAAISEQGGVRTYRPSILNVLTKALLICRDNENISFPEAVIKIREQNRLTGRPLPKRAVGSTLLLKGLEADVSVILDAGRMCSRNLYVAMTRGSKRLVVCSASSILPQI